MVNNRHKSPNCNQYTDHASTMFTFSARDDTQNNLPEYESFMVSCQSTNYEKPDDVTLEAMKDVASKGLQKHSTNTILPKNIQVDFAGIMLGTKSTDLAPEDIAFHRMASNCAPHFDITL